MANCQLIVCAFCSDDSDDPRSGTTNCHVCAGYGSLILCPECYRFGILKKFKDTTSDLFKISKGCDHLKQSVYCKLCRRFCNQSTPENWHYAHCTSYSCQHIEQVNRCRHCNCFDKTLYPADSKFVCGDCRDKHGYKCCEYSDCTRLTQGECELCDAPVCSEHQWCDDCE